MRAPGCPEKWSRRRMMPVLIIAGGLVRAARSGPRETGHPAALEGTSSVRAPHVANGRYHGVSLEAARKAVANVGVAIPDQVSVRLDWSAAEACPAQFFVRVDRYGRPPGV